MLSCMYVYYFNLAESSFLRDLAGAKIVTSAGRGRTEKKHI